MKSLLVPTDFSETANNAVEYAAEIAKATGYALILLHVHVPSAPPYTGLSPILSDDDESYQQYIHDQLNVLCNTLKEEYPSVPCTTKVVIGPIVNEIITVAKDVKAEMIIMGTQGISKIENIFFGSNTSSVIEIAPCPVLSVPFSAPFKVPEQILYATNFSYHDYKGAVHIVELAKAFDASIIVAHVHTENETTDREQKLIEKFSTEVSLLTDYTKIFYKLLPHQTVSDGLDAVIEETACDVLALSTRRRSLFERFYSPSLTKKYATHSTIPLLAFHNPEDAEGNEIDT